MATFNDITSLLTDIADAIRTKKGTSNTILAANLVNEILSIETSETPVSENYIVFNLLPAIKMYLDTDISIIPSNFMRNGADFGYNNSVKEIYLPTVSVINGFAFAFASNLITAYLPECTTIQGGNSFNNCTSLVSIDLPKLSSLSASSFNGCSSLTTVIIRANSVCSMGGLAFNNTPIASGTGYIYVPDALVEDYKVATNWSTYASQIKGISELPS